MPKEIRVQSDVCEFCKRKKGQEHTGKCPRFTLAAGKPTCPNCNKARQEDWVGHQVRGVYDGVLFWECSKCGHVWTRNFGTNYMNTKSQNAVNDYLVAVRGTQHDTGAE